MAHTLSTRNPAKEQHTPSAPYPQFTTAQGMASHPDYDASYNNTGNGYDAYHHGQHPHQAYAQEQFSSYADPGFGAAQAQAQAMATLSPTGTDGPEPKESYALRHETTFNPSMHHPQRSPYDLSSATSEQFDEKVAHGWFDDHDSGAEHEHDGHDDGWVRTLSCGSKSLCTYPPICSVQPSSPYIVGPKRRITANGRRKITWMYV